MYGEFGTFHCIFLIACVHSISGINWIISTQASTGRPAVVCMSIGGSASTAVDNAVAAVGCLFFLLDDRRYSPILS